MALAGGIIIGPQLLEWFSLPEEKEKYDLIHQATRFTLAMALMSTALRLPTDFFRKNTTTILSILTIGMLLMSVFSGLNFYWFLGLSFLSCMLLGAIVAPNDPVLATTIVSGKIAEKLIPSRVRNLISAESGSNDGLAFPS